MAGSSIFQPREDERPINASTFIPRPDSYFGRGKIAAVPSDPADVKRPRILVASDNAIEALPRAERTPVPKRRFSADQQGCLMHVAVLAPGSFQSIGQETNTPQRYL